MRIGEVLGVASASFLLLACCGQQSDREPALPRNLGPSGEEYPLVRHWFDVAYDSLLFHLRNADFEGWTGVQPRATRRAYDTYSEKLYANVVRVTIDNAAYATARVADSVVKARYGTNFGISVEQYNRALAGESEFMHSSRWWRAHRESTWADIVRRIEDTPWVSREDLAKLRAAPAP